MSAFFVEKETIDVVVSAMQKGAEDDWEYPCPGKELGLLLNAGEQSQVGKMLWTLNADAVRYRYQDLSAEEIAEMIPDNVWAYEHAPRALHSRMEVYKRARALLYQCNEGTCNQTDIYQQLERWAGNLACLIVADTEEYQATSWA